jgi:hypothetical protein
MTDGGVHTGYYFIQLLGSRQTEPLYLDFSYHLESLLRTAALIKLRKQHWSCFAQLISDCAFQLGENAVLTEGEGDRVARNLWSDPKSPQLLM